MLLNSNKPIKILQLEKLANQSIFNGAFMIDIISNSFYESNNSFNKKRKFFSEKDISTVKKIIVSGKYIAKMLNLKKFLVSACI